MSDELCKECNEKNPSDSLYCQNCGRRIISCEFYKKIRIIATEQVAKNKLIEDKQEKITDFSQFEYQD